MRHRAEPILMPFNLSRNKQTGRPEQRRPRSPVRSLRIDLAADPVEIPAAPAAGAPGLPPAAGAAPAGPADSAADGMARPQGSFRDFKAALRTWLTGIAPGRNSAAELAAKVGEEAVAAYQRGELGLDQLQYRAIDGRGFVGYRFGEELLEALGYYRPSTRAVEERKALARLRPEERAARVSNRWDGQFTGLQGAFSLKDFATAGVQEIAIGEAFAWHLQRIISLLPDDLGLGDMVGRRIEMDPPPGSRGIGRTTVEVTVSGILAAAHVYGAQAVADYLLGAASPKDDMAQGVHRLMREFAGYATPYDTIPQPSDSDVGRLIERVRGHSRAPGSRHEPLDDPDWLR